MIKLSARVIEYLDFQERKVLVKAFFKAQFKYCPFVWICHSHQLNERINRLHERELQLIYNKL